LSFSSYYNIQIFEFANIAVYPGVLSLGKLKV